MIGSTGTTLNVYLVSNPNINVVTQKYLPQSIDETKRVIENWSVSPSSYYNWDEEDGQLIFGGSATPVPYNIRFESQMFMTDGTNKYQVQTTIQENVGSGWVDIPNTNKLYQVSNKRSIVDINRSYETGDQIRMTVQLIPNPVPEDPDNYIPTYATILRTDDIFVWRNLLEQGFTDPLTGDGVDYPFINKRRYLFSPIILDVVPNLSETAYTLPAFQEVWYSNDAETIDITPTNDLDDIGKPCQ